MEINEKARCAIKEALLEHRMKYQEVITWSTDGFYRETKEKVAYRKNEGCAVVEMECSALAAVSAFRGATFGMILYTADSLADVDKYDERNWGGNAYEYALTLCLDAVIKL
jgi:uridine phosphorylase